MKIKECMRRVAYLITYHKLNVVGTSVRLSKNGVIVNPSELSIGSNVFIARGFHISANAMVIGDNVMIGPYLVAECDNHIYNITGRTMFSERKERSKGSIIIEDDVWIGGHVVLLKDVLIGEGCVIGAGSIVSKSMPPYTICFGNPCRPYKTRFSEDELKSHLMAIVSRYTYNEVLIMWQSCGLLKTK